MSKSLIALLFAFSLFTSPNLASADSIYKCKDSKGKTLYSESPCPSKFSGREIGVSNNVIESSGLRQQLRAQEIYSASQTQTQTNQMSDHERNVRLRENKVDSKSVTASPEKKFDALNEQQMLNQGQGNKLSQEDEVKRRNLKVDLDSSDSNKRENATSQLNNLYRKYRNPN